ncbi:MAG TPA: radical SAM protein [Spirochaetota bacterium]|nr:radical SAM protein [Spirochaetota bacterium]
MNKGGYLILDCYVDEPACLGVPPFIAPYPRYLYGALMDAGIPGDLITYLTIDALRESDFLLRETYRAVFLIGGAVVPGKYLGYRIGTLTEIRTITSRNSGQMFYIGGLISHVMKEERNVLPVLNDIEQYAFTLAKGAPEDTRRTYGDLARWAVRGAQAVRYHPDYPELICEMETYRGCPRLTRCSFCSESLKEGTSFREQSHILDEIDALTACGITRFRLGSQPDILQYRSSLTDYKNGFPRPSPGEVAKLFSSLKSKVASGAVTLLNIDNANPGTIVNFPEESSEILAAIAEAVTPGDTMSLGVESFDPAVIARNNLKVTAEELITAVEIINQAGGGRVDGIPVLLPGINLIHGLPGENADTFRTNYEVLKDILNRGLLLKRINIRKLQPFPGTGTWGTKPSMKGTVRNRFEYYREKIRDEIDHVMLQKIYPVGTVLRDLRIEDTRYEYSYGKQLGSYAITTVLPLVLPKKEFTDAVVTGHRERSLNALPVPVMINDLPLKALASIPGVGKGLGENIILARPLRDISELETIAPSLHEKIKAHCALR